MTARLQFFSSLADVNNSFEMEIIYLVIVVLLFVLAASDLIVGVSNDAVNFLNSAVGSKVSSFRVIMLVAALGILIGAIFSSGMMEVARKGIFNPGEFYFSEIMLIFLAVMITDVILLDVYNTWGLPTSTTVSIVFELLGASVGIASIKIMMSDGGLNINQFINSSKSLAIISGILISVVIAFSVGALIQYLIRIAFSFNFKKRMKYIGAIWGGIAFTALTYFILIKGASQATFMSDDLKEWFSKNTLLLMASSFVGWTIFLQLLFWIFRINILKIIVLVGTFSLAMAFAGNDLVNFIGVPIAGYNSWQIFSEAQGVSADGFLMSQLGGKVKTPVLFLIVAGIIMVITLYTSRKARSVLKTSIDLSRQEEGEERFRPTRFSKILVRSSIQLSNAFNTITPKPLAAAIERQFEPYQEAKEEKDPPAFDLIRASVNLTVASVLIAFGTSLKLPLSTTYVTFMVAMGTALADNAWGRESAVYRITGVISVIGGWFLTALSAFTLAFVMSYIFYFGEIYAIGVMTIVVIYLIYRSHRYHKQHAEEANNEMDQIKSITEQNIGQKTIVTVTENLKKVIKAFTETIDSLEKEDVKKLKKIQKQVDSITSKTKYLKDHINIIVDKLRDGSEDTSFYFVQVLDFMREVMHSLNFITEPAYEHVDNNHKPLIPEQIAELKVISKELKEIFSMIINGIENDDFSKQEVIRIKLAAFLKLIEKCNKNQIKRIKNTTVGTKNSMLYLNLLNESKHLGLNANNLYKSQRDFIQPDVKQ